MDVRSGPSPWNPAIPTALTRGPLAADEKCDVVVIGSGLSGALAAFHLAEAGADVVIIDKRPLSTGSTSVSTALIQYECDVPMVDLYQQIGRADARAAYHETRAALDDMRRLVEQNGFDCDFVPRPTLYLGREAGDIEHLRREATARQQIGIEATFLDNAELRERYHIDRPGAIRSSVSFELDPRKLTAELLSAASTRGARIYDQTSLADDPVMQPTVKTRDGHRVEATHVVYATGYETVERFPSLRDLCELKTTYALETQPLPRERLWPERALLWEMAEPYFYARTTVDDRVMIGGEDDDLLSPTARENKLPAKSQRLLERLKATVGLDEAKIDRAWAATFATTEDGLPLIGSPADAPHCHFNLGFGGNGILFGLIGAQIIRDRIAGQNHAAARLFGFDRFDHRRH